MVQNFCFMYMRAEIAINAASIMEASGLLHCGQVLVELVRDREQHNRNILFGNVRSMTRQFCCSAVAKLSRTTPANCLTEEGNGIAVASI